MKLLTKTLVALLASYAIVMIPRGMRVTMPEFWITPWLYGAPLLLLAWPIYFPTFKKLRKVGRWTLPLAGVLIAPLPFLVLIGVDVVLGNERSLNAYVPTNSIFGVWYAVFGAVLGGLVGWGRNHAAHQSNLLPYPSDDF
ncbi:MAG: hypothetical protein K2Y23_05840 [Cyanobacteria bacterium]|nr:hypothetical protein [Cyanobacteriota bacterium]